MASRTGSRSPMLRKAVTALSTTSASFTSGGATAYSNQNASSQKLSERFNKEQRRNLHITRSMRAQNSTSLLGINNNSNVPSSYFQRPSLPANTIVRFVPQQTAWIVERMGKFNRILQPGLAILWPFLDRIAYVKSLKESAIEIPSQSAITADNVTLELDGILYTRVFDAYKAR